MMNLNQSSHLQHRWQPSPPHYRQSAWRVVGKITKVLVSLAVAFVAFPVVGLLLLAIWSPSKPPLTQDDLRKALLGALVIKCEKGDRQACREFTVATGIRISR